MFDLIALSLSLALKNNKQKRRGDAGGVLELCLFSAVEEAGPGHRDTRSTAQGPSGQGPPSLPLLFPVLPMAGLGSFPKFQGFEMEGEIPCRALLRNTHPPNPPPPQLYNFHFSR